ncbi:MAG: hypothetical protein DIU72_001730 [Pseudomonadota bacterium]|nr:MAG: hypothetical protein DIU72_04205 [Pseudomonadota bacterium]
MGRVGEEGLRPTDVEYRQVLHRFTRHQALYQGLQRRLIWAATLEAPRFREVRSRAYASLLRMTQAEYDALVALELREAESFLDFFVGFFTETLAWNDLDAENSIWRLDLLVDGRRVLRPVAIERIVDPNPNVRALYPYLGAFSRAYRVRFPLRDESGQPLVDPQAQTLTLRVSSAIAHGELSWPVSLLAD